MTQAEKVLKWFETHDTLSRRQAINVLYINNITAVVSDMRRKGIDIETVYRKSKNSRYGEYRLGGNNGC